MLSKFALPNHYPAEAPLEEFLKPMGVCQNALARVADTSRCRINEIVLGKRRAAEDIAVRLAVAVGTWVAGAGYWQNREFAEDAFGWCHEGATTSF